MNQEVTAYIEKLPDWQIQICGNLRSLLTEVIPNVEEKLQYGKPHYLKNGKYAAVISAAKDKVSFMIFNATGLEEIKGYFASTTGADRKTATIKQGQSVDYEQLKGLLKKASDTI